MRYAIPPEALVTGCVPGCASRVTWHYDPGHPGSRMQPPEPDYFFPVDDACTFEHVNALDASYDATLAPDLYRQLHQWYVMLDGARLSKRSSQWYLGAGVGLAKIKIARNPIPVPPPTDDEPVF